MHGSRTEAAGAGIMGIAGTGNMREMKNTVRGAVLLTPDGERIAAGSLAFSVREADEMCIRDRSGAFM